MLWVASAGGLAPPEMGQAQLAEAPPVPSLALKELLLERHARPVPAVLQHMGQHPGRIAVRTCY